MLALAHTLYEEKLYDTAFITDYTVGFEQFTVPAGRVISSRKMPNGRLKSAG
jgi:anaerobic selenocysteine-containing dehydrogenase